MHGHARADHANDVLARHGQGLMARTTASQRATVTSWHCFTIAQGANGYSHAITLLLPL